MATATIDASAMRNVGPSSKSVWRHLLWKDFRQVWQLIVGLAVTQAFLQLLFGVMEMTIRVDMQNLSLNAINIALASPTLLAIACSGVLIGQERQTGCWTWSSSLPVSWRQSLLSKFIIWFGSSVVTMVVLLFVAAIALSMNQLSLTRQLFTEQADYGSWTYLMTLVIGVQVFIYLSIAALLIKDTLMAIVVAACGLFAFHCAVAVMNLMDVTKSLYGEGTGLSHESTILLAYLVSYIVGSIWLVQHTVGVGVRGSMLQSLFSPVQQLVHQLVTQCRSEPHGNRLQVRQGSLPNSGCCCNMASAVRWG